MNQDPVVYEVTLDIQADIANEFDAWLTEHIKEMLSIAGFQSAQIYTGTDEHNPHTNNATTRRTVSYYLRSQEELESYFHTHAARMRQQGIDKFGDKFIASRRIVPTAQYTAPEGAQLLLSNTESNPMSAAICANCRSPLTGQFCANCGQEDRTYFLSIWALVSEFLDELLTYDSKLFRSLFPLLFQPGYLTREYIRGRRAHFVRPLKLYLFISILFFFIANVLSQSAINESNIKANSGDETEQVDEQSADSGDDEIEFSTGDVDVDIPFIGFFNLIWPDFESRLEKNGQKVKENPEEFLRAMSEQIPVLMFVFLPIVALLLKFLYIGSKRYYVEHLIFSFHFHSFIFLLFIIWIYMEKIEEFYLPDSSLIQAFFVISGFYIPYYLWRSMRVVYNQGWFLTALKFSTLTTLYFIALFFTFVAFMVATVATF